MISIPKLENGPVMTSISSVQSDQSKTVFGYLLDEVLASSHDLRHTYASIMIEQGENIKYIQSQLGHSSPTVTLDVYAHLMKPTNQDAACRLENAILRADASKMVARTDGQAENA